MTLYRVTVEKTLQLGNFEKWSNVYHVNAATVLDAQDISDQIAALEQAIYKDYVQISRISVANPAIPYSAASRRVALGGDVVGSPTTMLPLFNTVLVKFIPAGGRPSPKYLRVPIEEAEVTGGTLETAFTNSIGTDYAVPLVALTGVCDEDGQDFIGWDIKHEVQMRQLGWHRRTRPGFRRGWVAV